MEIKEHLGLKPVKSCKYDLVSLGEIMLRLDPGDVPPDMATEVKLWHGGGETNVAEGASHCFSLRTSVVTGLVDDSYGRNIERQILGSGTDTSLIEWWGSTDRCKHTTDKKGTISNGIMFTWAGKVLFPSLTDYYRAHTAARELKPKMINWENIFGEKGVRWFHTGGIYTLISPSSSLVAIEALIKAKEYNVVTSFDLNYRAKVEPDKVRARGINKKVVSYVDVLFGNQSDFFDCLGYEANVDKDAPFEDWIDGYIKMLKSVAFDYPNLKLIGTQVRQTHSTNDISWGAVLYDVETDVVYQAPIRSNISIIERTGGGDSFVSGVAGYILSDKILGQKTLQEAVEYGAAHGIIKQCNPGDVTMARLQDVKREVDRARKGAEVITALR